MNDPAKQKEKLLTFVHGLQSQVKEINNRVRRNLSLIQPTSSFPGSVSCLVEDKGLQTVKYYANSFKLSPKSFSFNV